MARHNPASFAFGMLFEIAAVVVIVSLLPRFDLRPKTAASEPESSSFSTRFAAQTQPPREEVVIPTSFSHSEFTKSEEPRSSSVVFTDPMVSRSLTAYEVENRLDRASQGLVNTLGSAAASTANDLLYSAGRPALPGSNVPSFPTAEATSPMATYSPPRGATNNSWTNDSWTTKSWTANSWTTARPADASQRVTPLQSQQPWMTPYPTSSQEPTNFAPPRAAAPKQPSDPLWNQPNVSRVPRRWTNY